MAQSISFLILIVILLLLLFGLCEWIKIKGKIQIKKKRMQRSFFLEKTAFVTPAPVDTTGGFCSDARVKFLLPLALFAAFALSACNTIENRRSLYTNEKVHGPYTRSLEEGTWGNPQTVDEQYDASRQVARRPKVIQSKPAATQPSGAVAVPSSGADAAMPQ